MNTAPHNLPDNVAALKEIILTLTNQYDNRIHSLEQANRLLEEEKKVLLHRLFGSRSEKLSPEDHLQGRLFDEAETHREEDDSASDHPEPAITVQPYTRRKPGRKPLPESLPRVSIIHDIDENEKRCACGGELTCIGEEVSEKLDIIPAKIQVLRHVRYKYACRQCEGTEDDTPAVKTAPMPAQMVPQGIVSPGLLAWVLTSKFCDALPFYRQEKLFARIGVDISRATQCNWAMAAHRSCSRLLALMWQDLIASPLVGMDETHVQVMQEPGRKNTTKSYMWVFRGGGRDRPLVMFRYHPTRGSDFINREFAEYTGVIQTDGYQGYAALGKKEQVTHAACWAHVRRKFKDAHKGGSDQSIPHAMIDMIGMLYEVEAKIRENAYSPEKTIEVRQKESVPVVGKIEAYLTTHVHHVAPKSLTGKAIAYTMSLWQHLCVYLKDPAVSIDNNMVENAIRPFVVGRKNWLFSGSPRGADASAGLYSIIETARANGLEPYWYLRYLFEKLPTCASDDEIKLLMPHSIPPESVANFRSGVN